MFAPMKCLRPWNVCAHEMFAPMNVCTHEMFAPMNVCVHEMFAPMKCLRPWNVCAHEISAPMKYLRLHEMFAPYKECSRLILYDSSKGPVEISAAYKRCWRRQMLASRLLLFGLGRISNFCLLLSPAEELSSQKVLPLLHAVLKWNLLTNLLSLYGQRLCRTVPACCTGTTCLNVRAHQMFAAANTLTLFSEKNQKPNSAHKCPITSSQIRIESQKLSEFSCITFRSLNGGRPPFQPQSLKITSFWPRGGYYGRGRGGGGLDKHYSACAAYDTQ